MVRYFMEATSIPVGSGCQGDPAIFDFLFTPFLTLYLRIVRHNNTPAITNQIV